jgi:excisionase family DNA binding protein
MTRATVYTPATLADKWGCSERHVRNMIDRGELPHFRLGGKLLRIRADIVEAYECQNGGSPGFGENTASHGTIPPSQPGDGVIDLAQQTRKRQPAAPRLDTPNLRARAGRR